MRLNKFLAQATGMSRRAADTAIFDGRVQVNNGQPSAGYDVQEADLVTIDGHQVTIKAETQTIILNKPKGYVCSRNGQGSKTIYELLPAELHHLKPVGRLDKDSTGLLLMTNDGELAHRLTHPSFQKVKMYTVGLDASLQPLHHQMISDYGIQLEDGISKLQLEKMQDARHWQVTIHEGRNRQIRRTFAALGYTVTKLHRTDFGPYTLGRLPTGKYNIPRVL